MKKLLFFASAVALFASCSKDLTEDVAAPVIEGNNKIVASYESDAETRAHAAVKGTTIQMAWDNGDALGVFAQSATTTQSTNAYFGFNGEEFYGNLMNIKGNDFFIYYPWTANKKIENGKIALEIPATQLYGFFDKDKNPGYSEEYGSFASGTVPSVAKASIEGEKTKDSELKATMSPLASYITFYMTGVGKVETLKLQIKDKNGNFMKLAGDISVDLTKESKDKKTNGTDGDTVFFTIDATNATADAIILDCGEGVTLSKENKTAFMFAVLPYFELKGAVEFLLTVNKDNNPLPGYKLADATNVTVPRNYGQPINQHTFNWIDGAEGAYVISTPAQFVEYAYAATKGVKAVTDLLGDEKHDMFNYDAQGNATGLKTALIVEPIDLKKVVVSENHGDYEGDEAKYGKFYNEIYYKWFTPNKVLETIGGAAEYHILGNVDGKAAEISGIEVKGNGVFASTFGQYSTVKNIVLKGAKVDAGDETKAYFVADNIWNFGAANAWGQGIEVTVDGGELIAKEGVKKAWFGTVQSPLLAKKPVKVAEGTTAPAVDYYAHSLAVFADGKTYADMEVTLGEEYFTYTNDVATVHFGEIYAHTAKAMFVNVDDRAAALGVIAAINHTASVGDKPWFSVVTRKADKTVDTSYWTGFSSNAYHNNDGVFTAEEFVYEASNGSNYTTVTMTNNIDFNYKEYQVSGGTNDTKKFYIDGTDAKYAIMRARVTKGLVGNKTDVSFKNVEVGPTFIDLYGADATPFLLAKSGVAENVTANILTYEYKDGATAKDGIVAGLFYEGTIDQLVKTTGCEVKNAKGFGEDTFAAIYAYVDVPLGHNYDVPAITLNDDLKPFAVFNCYYENVTGHKHEDNTDINFIGMAKDYISAEAIVNWDASQEPINKGHRVTFHFNGDKDMNNFVQYKGIVKDLASVAAAAARGEEIIFGDNIDAAVSGTTTKVAAIQQNGGIIDGAGNTLANTAEKMVKTNNTWAIETTGGTIKNLTITGPGRHIGGATLTQALTVEKCNLGEGGAYWANIGDAGQQDVKFVECVLEGWASFVNTKTLTFEKCTFKAGNYWSDVKDDPFYNKDSKIVNNAIAIYGATTFINCDFSKDFSFDVGDGKVGGAVTIKNCTIEGTPVTKADQLTNNEPDKVTITVANN